jgi:hypothetical protein
MAVAPARVKHVACFRLYHDVVRDTGRRIFGGWDGTSD